MNELTIVNAWWNKFNLIEKVLIKDAITGLSKKETSPEKKNLYINALEKKLVKRGDLMLPDKEIERLNKLRLVSEDQFFKYCESLVDTRKFNNIQKWKDRKGYKKIDKYRREEKIKIKALDQERLNKLNKVAN
jgi:hypothetical protein